MYIRFAKVDLSQEPFCDLETLVATLSALRRALVRRAVRIQRMHAVRLHTPKPNGIPEIDAAKFSTLISMSCEGEYTLTPLLPRLIGKYETALKDRKAAQANNRGNRRLARKRHRPP